MTWYVARGGGAVVSDTSEACGFSEVVRLGELCEAVSTGGELVVVGSSLGVSVVVRVGTFWEVVSAAGELIVVASSVGVRVVVRVVELCEAVSTGGELVVVVCPVGGKGEVFTGTLFASFVTPRITKTSNTPVNSAIVPKESFFTREACLGNGGGTVAGCGGAPHEGQAAANELISLPHS